MNRYGYDNFGNPIISPQDECGYPNQMSSYQVPNQGMFPQQRHRSVTKKDILEYLRMFASPSEIVQVEEFDTPKTRHICRGGKSIVLLPKQTVDVPTPNGQIRVEVFFCGQCRKLLVNSQTLEVY